MLELYEGLDEPGVPVVGGDTTRPDARRAQRHRARPLGARARPRRRAPGDLLVVTGPLGAAGAAFREGRYVRPPLRLDGGQAARRARARAARRLGRDRASTRATSPRARSPLRDRARARARSPRAPTLDDLGFGEDYELLAAVADPGGFTVIGRCEEGEGSSSSSGRPVRARRAGTTSAPLDAAGRFPRPWVGVIQYLVRRLLWAVVLLIAITMVTLHALLRDPDPAGHVGRGGREHDEPARVARRQRPDLPGVRPVRLARRPRLVRRVLVDPRT